MLAVFAVLAIAGPAASSARAAEFEIAPDGFQVKMLNAEGQVENRAGSHPDRIELNFALHMEGTTARDLVFELPAGLAGNPDAVQACSRAIFESGEECPPESQVGAVKFTLTNGQEVEIPSYQVEPGPGEFISFGSKGLLGSPLKVEVRPSDFGVTMTASDLPKLALAEGHVELWGVPADHQVGTSIPRRPAFTTPTRCGPLVFGFRVRSWEEGAPWLSASADTGAPLEGCAGLSFAPVLGAQFSNPIADSPTGLDMELITPEEDETSELADALIKDVSMQLPDGVTVSPAGAAGLTACTDAQLDLESSGEAHCPPSSKVGTVEFASGALSEPLLGSVYLGQERPPERFRTFIVAPGPGVVIKFVGSMHVDPATGKLSTTLTDLPQMPLHRFRLSFNGGPGALLASPLACGPTAAVAKFTPYGGGPLVESRVPIAIGARIPGSRCPGPVPFAPRLVAHSSQTRIGAPTTLSVSLLRQDGEQALRRFSMTLPAGLSAGLGAIQSCSDADVAAETCPAASRVGGLLVKIGPGSNPVTLHGDSYITGPYRRAPFGLLLQLHAKIGPLDLGTTSFQAAAHVSGKTGRVTVSTDALAVETEGVPVRFQEIEMSMDRPGLLRNPTSCRPTAAEATIEASSGAVETATSPLVLSGCNRLGFRPRFRIAFERGGGSHGQADPGLRISTHMRAGDTAMRSLKMILPRGLGFRMSGLEEICSRPDAAAGSCPAGSQVGTAVARSSLSSKPLRGVIHIVQPKGNGMPDLGIGLSALGVNVNVEGQTEVHDGRLVTKLAGLPDMPLSDFTMRMDGGRAGTFSLGTGLCRDGRPRRFEVTLVATGQDGSLRRARVPLETNARCG